MAGQVVDAEAAEEFMRETLEKVSPEVLTGVVDDLRAKSAIFAERLAPHALASADPADLRAVLRLTFSGRRKADAILKAVGPESLAAAVNQLLWGPRVLPERFDRFQSVLAEFPAAAFELPSEILHFTQPDQYWLWTRWMWDPRPETGALALVTADDVDLHAETPGNVYISVGRAVAFVSETGQSAGFAAFDQGPFGIDVFLGCVYAVYMYTVLRLRMTQEFNRIVPQQAELVRRLLGVHGMET
ncbi:MAG: hypothetical protein OEM40_00320 [Acidimicrobiia bacterium]|nr:hypothetical protein [Acidimicrobiia bacterium]